MKAGSIIECVKSFDPWYGIYSTQCIVPKLEQRFVCDGFDPNVSGYIYLAEEARCGYNGARVAYDITFFREIQFPPSFEKELSEVIEEVINNPVEI